MKKFQKNSIVFLFAVLFLLLGFSKDMVLNLGSAAKHLCLNVLAGSENPVETFEKRVDTCISEMLRYHGQLMDLSSVLNNLEGKRIIKKGNDVVVKADSGSLISPAGHRLDEGEVSEIVTRVEALQRVSEENGAKFLYCAAPRKEYYEIPPVNSIDYSKENFDHLMNGLSREGIPLLDFSTSLQEAKIPEEDLYFDTDHHWKPYSGFVANRAICEELSRRYGFEYDSTYTDIQNYDVTTYPDWFLGSTGKKVGTYFDWSGAEDFDLITPKFPTEFTEEQPLKDEVRTGGFQETLLFLDNMEKNFYEKNAYATYSGGDFRLQIMRNEQNPEGKKILLIRDSFACTVAPFLALQTSELHICDMRNYDYYVGDKLNAEEYIKEVQPDYVIVLYCYTGSVQDASGRFDFF